MISLEKQIKQKICVLPKFVYTVSQSFSKDAYVAQFDWSNQWDAGFAPITAQFLMNMKFILGTKQRMTQIFDESGRCFPATILSAGPVVVTQVKTDEKDGYTALQVGFGKKAEKNINKAQKGHLKDRGAFEHLREFRGEFDGINEGDSIDVSAFEVGDTITVSATSKGKGFQGVVKRHNFAGGPRTHGQKHSERAPGSIGSTGPQRVFKGLRMAGRMGSDRITVKNLTVLQIDKESNTLVVSGAVPGKRGTLVEVRSEE